MAMPIVDIASAVGGMLAASAGGFRRNGERLKSDECRGACHSARAAEVFCRCLCRRCAAHLSQRVCRLFSWLTSSPFVRRRGEPDAKRPRRLSRNELLPCFFVEMPTGVPAVPHARHSGTTGLSVHCGSSDLSCALEGTPGRGACAGQAANLSEFALSPKFVGRGAPTASQMHSSAPVAGANCQRQTRIGRLARLGRALARKAARSRFVASACWTLPTARRRICASFANIAHLLFRCSRLAVSVGKRPPSGGRLPSRGRCCREQPLCLAVRSAGSGSGLRHQSWYCPFCFLLVANR
jgi:hypothetical protein